MSPERSGSGPSTLVIAWSEPGSASSNRVVDLARVLGGETSLIYPVGGPGPARKAARYLLSVPLTFLSILRRRPSAVIGKNPPMFCALVAYLAARVLRVPYVMDSHPGGFGLQNDTLSLRLQPIHRWLIPRARATLVTEETLKAQVDAWGGKGVVLHEAPPTWQIPPRTDRPGGPLKVFYVGIFSRDEPTELVLEAARLLPEAEFTVTGDTALADPALLASAPPNVHFCGYLKQAEYVASLEATDVVLVLTGEPTSVARSGYDAVWANRPLVISDTPASRSAFPFAVHVENDAARLAESLREVTADLPRLAADATPARARAEDGWAGQQRALRQAVGLAS